MIRTVESFDQAHVGSAARIQRKRIATTPQNAGPAVEERQSYRDVDELLQVVWEKNNAS